MQNYDIRYDDKYGQLAQIDVAAEGAGYEPWVNQTLTSVNDSVVRLAVIEGELVDWHSHEHEDEFFLVLEGKLELEVEGREPFVLGVHQGVTIPRGVLHHPRAHGRVRVRLRRCTFEWGVTTSISGGAQRRPLHAVVLRNLQCGCWTG